LLALMTIALFLYSCGGKKGSIEEARKAYAKKEYAAAGEIYKKVYSTVKSKDLKKEACFYTAECYRLANDLAKAESWYLKTVKSDPKNTDAQLRLAQCLKYAEKYSESIVEANNYKKAGGSDSKVDCETQGASNALKWKNSKTRYQIENIKAINSKWSDYAPMYFRKDQLFFSSDRMDNNVSGKSQYAWTNNGFSDIYTVNLKMNKKNKEQIDGYGLPVLADKKNINGKYNDGAVCFDAKFSTMYLTKCNYGPKNDGKGTKCRIYVSHLQGTEWSEPEALPFSTDSLYSCGHPFLSKDGQTLFFSSDMPGSIAKPVSTTENPDGNVLSKDLWMVTYAKRGNTWGDPVNLGPTINTEGDEVFPFLHEDGTLYFSSNGHCGMGGMDIYYTKGSVTDWSDPINMKAPINSGGDDFAAIISKDKESGFFTSNRLNGKGSDDIYRFTMTPLVFTLSGVIRNCKTREAMPNAVVTITSSNDTGRIILKTDATGSYKLKLKGRTDYELFASYEYYFDSKTAFQTTKGLEFSTDLVQDLEVCAIPVGDYIRVEGIYYGLDSADLRPKSRMILDTLAATLMKYPKARIELGSHTDCRADSVYNIGLSQRRADSAVAYLIAKGVDSARIVAKGYGENQLVNKCACEGPNERIQGQKCTEEEHQMNRRTTVRFLDFKFVDKTIEKLQNEKIQQNQKGIRGGGTLRPGQQQPTRK